ncbi:hypothetical protein Pse7367_3678 (plasmid) [Thalassoporum mexicanum PCC 7367]|uniref:hypothetical protein n=1 Tax=Thalassoporum mexicanum TaxID=3457544 RepID=UPI00029FC8B6|nr:hypothetical protein [Pseudanabaena sp. PCC 7367]AFY71911.1 hypothetical protein Pse7367_3678 [Pseudanabaena sp. PCC 7367]
MNMEKDIGILLENEHEFIGIANELNLDNFLIEGIKFTFEKLRYGETLSHAEYRLLEVFLELLETG